MNVTESPTITTPAMMTGVGVILGTAAYMSPEQAKGRPADKRSDIWAFGCVLYEMFTGKRAFEGEDVSDTLAAVLEASPIGRASPQHATPDRHTDPPVPHEGSPAAAAGDWRSPDRSSITWRSRR